MKNRKVSLGVLALVTASLVLTAAAGPVLAEERTGAVTAVSAEVDAADIVSFRSKFRVLDDRD